MALAISDFSTTPGGTDMATKRKSMTLDDLEELASAVSRTHHFRLNRTRNADGRWEARFDNWDDGCSHGQSHNPAEAIKRAIANLPAEVRDLLKPQEPDPLLEACKQALEFFESQEQCPIAGVLRAAIASHA